MPFQRIPSPRWAEEVPGTRWYKADLHLHTLDDHPGGRAERPPGLNGDPTDPEVLRAYARHFLQSAIARRVQVLGLTPHDVRTGPQTSAVWTIVEVWASEQDDDGTPFRDKLRAVFPGFEPSLNVGRRGVHLIFLFDPEIGRDRFLRLFDALMGGVPPWENGQLRISGLDAVAAFERLDDMHQRDNAPPDNADRWDYLVLAPHAFSGAGLFNGVQAQVLQQFPSARLSAIELSDDQTPEQATSNRPWLRPAMRRPRHAFYHSSDAYGFDPDPTGDALFKVGSRCTLLKLSSPRIEALRQAFLADESRLRLMYHRDAADKFVLRSDLPEPCPAGPGARPWVRELKVTGGTSFLRGQTFRLSPDLTCIIGGSMTGKSTLLDGLRLTMLGEAGLPAHGSAVRKTVEDRARNRFLSGSPQVELESPAGDLARPVPQRFGMQFFSQGELKDMAETPEAIEQLLFHLVPGRADGLLAQRGKLRELDQRLATGAGRLTDLQERVAEAEQLFQRAEQAREAMERFAQAGTTDLPPAQKDVARTREFARAALSRLSEATALVEALRLLNAPDIHAADVAASLTADPAVDTLLARAGQHAADAAAGLAQVSLRASQLETAATTRHQQLVAQVQRALVAAGGSAEDLNAFDAYSKAAHNYDSYQAALDGEVTERDQAQADFDAAWQEREQLVASHRASILAVCQEVGAHHDQRVRIVVEPEGRRAGLNAWVDGLRKSGITRWWNAGAKTTLRASALEPLLRAMDEGRTADAKAAAQALGMTPTVSDTLLEALAPWGRRLEVWAQRCPDRYRLQWVEDGVAKDLDQLSGGRKVAVLLALLLESDDTTPLVVDQPEDELDNRFLNETIIPALHRLKGKRQVIFATHNANIVVNGDADRVIALEADAQYGRVYAEGAIENPAMREAILKTLDGGKEAFRLRRAKYGF